jgi:hypothetical protein
MPGSIDEGEKLALEAFIAEEPPGGPATVDSNWREWSVP